MWGMWSPPVPVCILLRSDYQSGLQGLLSSTSCVASGRPRSRDTLPVHCTFSFYFSDSETLKIVLMALLLYRKNHTKVCGEARSILALYTVRELRGKGHAKFQL